MDRGIPITPGNSDRKVTQPIRITKETILAVHFFNGILTNVIYISYLNKLASSYYAFLDRSVLTLINNLFLFIKFSHFNILM